MTCCRNLFDEGREIHIKIPTIVAAIPLALSLALIIGGSFLVARNSESWKPVNESTDQMNGRHG